MLGEGWLALRRGPSDCESGINVEFAVARRVVAEVGVEAESGERVSFGRFVDLLRLG